MEERRAHLCLRRVENAILDAAASDNLRKLLTSPLLMVDRNVTPYCVFYANIAYLTNKICFPIIQALGARSLKVLKILLSLFSCRKATLEMVNVSTPAGNYVSTP